MLPRHPTLGVPVSRPPRARRCKGFPPQSPRFGSATEPTSRAAAFSPSKPRGSGASKISLHVVLTADANCIPCRMNAFELCHCGDIDDRCGHSPVAQRREEVGATRENRSTRLSEGVDSLFKCSRSKIQQRHLHAAGDQKPCAASQLFVYRMRLFVKRHGSSKQDRSPRVKGSCPSHEVWYFHPTLLCGHSEVLRRAAKFRPYSLGSGCASGLPASGRASFTSPARKNSFPTSNGWSMLLVGMSRFSFRAATATRQTTRNL